MERAVEELHTLAEDVEKQKNRIVEAVWRAIVGSETPKREDGELIIQGPYSPETRYYFRYKGKDAAILTIKEFMPGRISYPNIEAVLVLAYLDREIDASRYDDTTYPPLEKVPRRYAILRRNEWMVSVSDVVISGVLHSWGGAARTLEFAQ